MATHTTLTALRTRMLELGFTHGPLFDLIEADYEAATARLGTEAFAFDPSTADRRTLVDFIDRLYFDVVFEGLD